MTNSYFQFLYHELLNYEGNASYAEVLLPELDKAQQTMDSLKAHGEIQARHVAHEKIVTDLWELYALSRVNDVLLLPFQQGDFDGNSWPGPKLTMEERESYLVSLGMRAIDRQTYHPFFHEIVEVVQLTDPAAPVSLDGVVWSGFMLGSLLVCRAGVKVSAGRKFLRKEIAEKSKLYFTFRRKNRPVDDLSHGWGSNSQWRTSFRRDYVDESHFYYNVDGSNDLSREVDDQLVATNGHLRPAEKIELLTNRCLVLSERPDPSLWPYDDTFTERKG